MTIRNDQLTVWTKKLQSIVKAKLVPKKKSQVTAWWSAVGMIHYSFLNLSETITSGKYAQKLMRCTENCNTCSWHWPTERAQFFCMTTPNCTLHIQHSRSLTNWAKSSASFIIFSWPVANQLTLIQASGQLFCRENTSTINKMQKMLLKSLLNTEAQIFTLQE